MLLAEFTQDSRVAYFSMEIALHSKIPTYSGGLGVLAGDTMRSAADLELRLVAVTLVSRRGYFRQEIDSAGWQIEHPEPWRPEDWATPLGAKIAVDIAGRPVWICAWLYVLQSQLGGRQPVLLLDTDLPENRPEDREITHYLYGGDDAYRLKQEIVLGIGGVRMLHALGFRVPMYHMNEGHSALLGVELLRTMAYPRDEVHSGEAPYDLPRVRSRCRFTTHTPVEAGHDRFSYELVRGVLGEPIDLKVIKALAGQDVLNMTRLALNLSEFVNGVAKSHARTSGRMFPGYQVHAVTNGVHPYTWAAESFRSLYDRYLQGWGHETELLMRADCCLPDESVIEAHARCKAKLIESVRAKTGVTLDPDVPILGFSRRMTAYKRPDLLFSDLERLRSIARRRRFQIVLAGKAHPRDGGGKQLIRELHSYIGALRGDVAAAYVPDYGMDLALEMVSGADVWINTPLRPLEASGTSGMKAALNGVPSLSVLDGWWVEGCIEGVTGWSIDAEDASQDAAALYDKLEHVVLPLFYGQTPGETWVRVMKGAISKNASYFNSHRMMRRYSTEAYLR
ncbi:MAG TPA: alpha-glucan family phosphorylase [Steroidobacter sp.]|jgi:starch phosphorylase|nr:alpha-glucan family phosphorylase [Steroidobacteraceae bacterium]HLS82377.1 alpha-glucan family phosphorylase [Steroidobacter sp.]